MAELADHYPAFMLPQVQNLLGCDWGRTIRTDDDPQPCGAQAVQRIVLHDTPPAGLSTEVQLCGRHGGRVLDATAPHGAATLAGGM